MKRSTLKSTATILAASLLVYISTAQAQSPAALQWVPREDLNVLLPPSIQVYEANGTLSDGARVRAVYATIDLRDHNLNLRAVGSNTIRETTKETADKHNAILAINAGYFSATASVSMLVSDGETIAPGPVNGVPRGAFGLVNGKPEIVWPLIADSLKRTFNKYPNPHTPGSAKLTANHPAGAQPWKPSQAVGGGPMLVKAGKMRDTSQEEGFGESHLKRHPRTAIGYRDENTLLMMVVDGRQQTSAGVTIVELAQLMLNVGCYEAVNLDGGGSSAMIAASEVVNIPVDIAKGDRHCLRKDASALVLTESKSSIPDNIIYLDTNSPSFSVTGLWKNSDNPNCYGSMPSRVDSTSGNQHTRNTATYRFDKIDRGTYQLAAWWAVDETNTDHAAYVLHHDHKTDTLYADQRTLSSSGKWNVLGYFKLGPGDSLELMGNNKTGKVVVDAVRLVAVPTRKMKRLSKSS